MRIYHKILVVILWATLWSCSKPFEAESFTFNKVIVVDSRLTDETKFHQVKLSFTIPIGEDNASVLSGATVWVEDEDNGRIDYEEIEPGTYQTATATAGEAGKTYQLFFTTEEGERYASTPSTLIPSPPIDSIYDEFLLRNTEETSEQVEGIQFFIDSHDDTEQAKFFRYEWEEAYRINVPFPSDFIYDFDLDSVLFRQELISICYSSNNSNGVTIGTTVGSEGNRIAQQPVRYIDRSVDFLRIRYAILVRQHAISESAFGFYRKLKESNESGGSLFDTQQGTIAGNIISLDNPSETILGFFEVSGVSELRTFFSRSDLDDRFEIPSYRFQCIASEFIDTPPDSLAYWLGTFTQLRIVGSFSESGDPTDTNVRYNLASRNCADCSWFASTTPPEFWEN